MSKQADRYFDIDPWQVVERGFDPAHGESAESIFSLGNEYMGLRGYFEEGYSGARLQGSYVGGLYERVMLPHAQYKSMVPFIELMTNTVDWVWLPVQINGVPLDLASAGIDGFIRALDLRTGVLTRTFVWHVDADTDVRLTFERFLSMPRPHQAGQRLALSVLRGKANVTLSPGLDFSQPHMSTGRNHWTCEDARAQGDVCRILGTTNCSKQTLFAAALVDGLQGGVPCVSEKRVCIQYTRQLGQGDAVTLSKRIALLCGRDYGDGAAFSRACDEAAEGLNAISYDALKRESADWWAKKWEASDIRIEGDAENQQGIRYCIFQMHQTLHTAERGAVIGAKGLTGEMYSGNAFWDSEVYCLPFYLLSNPRAARNILQFRYDTLPEAKERARALDLNGAFYPIATISGHECCNLWQHANLQLQASTGVAYGIWHYTQVTGDKQFLYHQGAEMLIEISRMLASRGAYSQKTGEYGYYCVMGPDEFQMMVNHNAYTNYMAKRTLEYTLSVLKDMRAQNAAGYASLLEKTGASDAELADFGEKAAHMRILYDKDRLLFEQHDGFFDLPHVDVQSIPIAEFPLYSHWAYDRLYRNDMIKQPDVLMFMLLYSSAFSKEQLRANYDYYEPRCIHESSLSPSVHSILASQLGRKDEATRLFGFATRLDLDDYNRNTREGLHLTAIAASWMNIVYGFGGVRTDGDTLSLRPILPDNWTRYRFTLQYRGALIAVDVGRSHVTLSADTDAAPEIILYGAPVRPTVSGLRVPLA